jgi:hypothetical protein
MSIVLLGSTSGSCTLQEQAVAGTTTLTLPTFNGTVGLLVSGTAVASTSGTSIDFTGLPAGVRRITVMHKGVSTSGTSNIIIQLGTGATPTYTTTGYLGTCSNIASASAGSTQMSTGFMIKNTNAAASLWNGNTFLNLQDSSTNTWCVNGAVGHSNDTTSYSCGGSIAIAAVLTAVRITTVNGTDTFDAGSINILYE